MLAAPSPPLPHPSLLPLTWRTVVAGRRQRQQQQQQVAVEEGSVREIYRGMVPLPLPSTARRMGSVLEVVLKRPARYREHHPHPHPLPLRPLPQPNRPDPQSWSDVDPGTVEEQPRWLLLWVEPPLLRFREGVASASCVVELDLDLAVPDRRPEHSGLPRLPLDAFVVQERRQTDWSASNLAHLMSPGIIRFFLALSSAIMISSLEFGKDHRSNF
ncbi:hypothetical protein BHE74_00002775 [Ensete ventricosum]|nr:hypothetical protein BHE74_00002775 [Ensete ventricosum]